MGEPTSVARTMPALVYAALCTAVVSSLGMLLVPSIAEEMQVSVSTAQWMLTINLLVGAISTPVMGRLSDGPHKKPLLLSSLVVILIGSLLAAAAPNFAIFLLGRALQGLSYGIVPVTIALARRYLPERQVRPAISTLSVTVTMGIGIGYPLTGLIAGVADVRIAFWCAALFVATAVVVVFRAIPAGSDERSPRMPFDFVGAALLGLGLGTLLLGVSEGPNIGWGSPQTIGIFSIAALSLIAWVWTAWTLEHPLINLRVFRKIEVVLANLTAIGLGAALYIGMSISSLVAQAPASTGYGLAMPVLWAGFVMLPLSVGSFGANRLVRRLAHRVGLTSLLPTGTGLVMASGFLLWFAHSALWELLIGMFLFGLGIGASYAAMPALIERSVATTELGSSVSFNQVLRTIGSSFGTAISGAVLAAAGNGLDHHATGSGITLTLAIGALICTMVFCALMAHRILRRRTSGP